MGKITLAVLLAAIALGVYWFWWSDQGANNHITVEGTGTVTGMPLTPGTQGPVNVAFALQATSRKLKGTATLRGETVSAIIRLDKREMYILNDSKKLYSQMEFDLVDTSETKPPEESEETWPSELKRTAEWDYVGTGEAKRFCNKQTFSGLPDDILKFSKTPATGAALPPGMEALLGGIKCEMWFTPETRLGRRYFSMLNRLTRIRQVGEGQKQQEKRPQFKYVNLDFFPIPMKAVISLGPVMRVEMEVKNLSRKKIPKSAFEIPSGYRKVSRGEVLS